MADYGIKISKEGYDVLTATEQQLAFTSKYPVLKAKLYGLATASGFVSPLTIAHGLSYRPAFFAYAKGSTFRFKLPRFYLGSDPVGGGISGHCYSDTTNVYIFATNGIEIYYYIFVDPIT